MADTFVFSNRAVTALQDSVDQFETVFDFGVDDLDRFPTLSGGAKFPIILSDREDVYEICYVTALSVGGEATVERAREGTAAVSWSAGTFVEHCMTAGSFLTAARLVPKGEWSAATNYLAGDVVVYTGISYIATQASLNQVPSAVSAYWQTLYTPPGISSTALTWSGDWNSGTTYAIGAYVKYQGKLYVAIAAGLNHLPTDASWWTLLSTTADPVTFDNVLTAAGTNNYTVAPSPAPTALFDGMELSIVFTNSNTAASTLAVGALAPAPLRPKTGVDFASGELPAGTLLEFVYRSGTSEFVAKSAAVFAKQIADLVAVDAARTISLMPIGTVLDFAGPVTPTGWLHCGGQAVSRVTYAALFAVLGGTYGVGDGSTTFNLPDLRGRVTAGKDDMGPGSANRLTALLNGDVLGATGGNEKHSLVIGEVPSHSHGGAVTGAGGHEHNYVAAWEDYSVQSGSSTNVVRLAQTRTTTGGGGHVHGIAAEGGGAAHDNVQPTFVLYKIIFAGV